jgi:hypothetical protein
MAVIEQIVCDGCGKRKQQTNHWWLFNEDQYTGEEIGIGIFPWHEPNDGMLHFCGAQCVIKAVSEWMSKHGPEPGK